MVVGAAHIYNGILFQWVVGYHFSWQVLDGFYPLTGRQGHECVQKTDQQVGMLAEYAFEYQIILGVKITFHDVLLLCYVRKDTPLKSKKTGANG
jgi:hypothetical protein